jgi:hypothetical protein
MSFGFFKEHKDDEMELTNRVVQAKEGTESIGATEEHYDGTTFKDLYPEQPRTDWDHTRGSVKNVGARVFLQRVREIKREITLLERRVTYRTDAGLDTDDLEKQIASKQEELKIVTSEVADEISKIGNVGQEMVLTMRYIDMKSWDEIAESMDIRVKTVLKFHGYGLVHMNDVLVTDGLIEEECDEESTSDI